jgi:hypothetical protein
MNSMPNKFRPSSSMDKKNVMKMRLKYGRVDNYNWQSRIKWYPAGYRLNRQVLFNQFSKLHYLACHAPKPITKKWCKAYNNFYKKHFGAFKGASMRYLNTWSCHSWL